MDARQYTVYQGYQTQKVCIMDNRHKYCVSWKPDKMLCIMNIHATHGSKILCIKAIYQTFIFCFMETRHKYCELQLY